MVRKAFDRYCEARTAAGDVIPEAYFGHHIEWMTDDEAKATRAPPPPPPPNRSHGRWLVTVSHHRPRLVPA